jgi:hypothetical protein
VISKEIGPSPSGIDNSCFIDLAKHVFPHVVVHDGEDGVENENVFCREDVDGACCSKFPTEGNFRLKLPLNESEARNVHS